MNLSRLPTREVVAAIAGRIAIADDRAYSVDGHATKVRAAPDAGHAPLVDSLTSTIYSRFYTNPTNVSKGCVHVDDSILQQRFLAELVRANSSRWSWSGNWRIVGEEEGRFRLESGASRMLAPPQLVDGPDEHGFGRVRQEKGSATAQRAWYWAYGEDNVPSDRPRLLRLYWTVSAEGAVPLLRVLTRTLNEQRVPFQFKTLQDPQTYTRSDSAVLYLPAYTWDRASYILGLVHERIAHYLVHQTPLFAKPLGRGLSIAEDPGEPGTSFGMHRSRLIAEGLWQAHARGDAPGEATQATVFGHIESKGYDVDRLHLNPGASRDYDLPDVTAPIQRRN